MEKEDEGFTPYVRLSRLSSFTLAETERMVHRKEFGIQSGSLIPKIQKRAGALKALGWVQLYCEDIGPAGLRLLSENQEFIKGKAMIPTTELPLAWCEESTVLAITEKENVRKTLKRQRDAKKSVSIGEEEEV